MDIHSEGNWKRKMESFVIPINKRCRKIEANEFSAPLEIFRSIQENEAVIEFSSDDNKPTYQVGVEKRECSPEIQLYSDETVERQTSPILQPAIYTSESEALVYSISQDTVQNASEAVLGSSEGESVVIEGYPLTDPSSPDQTIKDVSSSPSSLRALNLCPSPVVSKSKSSNWLKTVQWQLKTPEKDVTVQKRHYDSDKKRKKHLQGGLAEQLERLIVRDESEIAIWKHSQRFAKGELKSLRVRIISMHKEYLNVFAHCEELESTGESRNHTVMLAATLVKSLKIEAGNVIRIHLPWSSLKVTPDSVNPIILCAKFVDVVDQTRHINPQISTCVCKWSCSCVKGPLMDPKCHCHATQGRPTETVELRKKDVNIPSTPALTHYNANSDFNPLSTKALESVIQATEFHDFDVIACVQRVFHYYSHSAQIDRWSLLLEDRTGFFSLLQVSSEKSSLKEQWSKITRGGEGKSFYFTNLRLQRTIDKNRLPALFSIFGTLQDVNGLLVHPMVNYQAICYVITASDLSSTIHELQTELLLYVPPVMQNINDILKQNGSEDNRCSTLARLLHVHNQNLFMTDKSLMDNQEFGDGKNYVAVLQTPAVIQNCRLNSGCVLFLKDILKSYENKNALYLDKYSRVYCLTCLRKTTNDAAVANFKFDNKQINILTEMRPSFNNFNETTISGQLVNVTGTILRPDIETAYSWPVCNVCNDHMLTEIKGDLFCNVCEQTVLTPTLNFRLEVYLSCSNISSYVTIKLKLKQSTIESLLPASGHSTVEGYDVECITNKQVGPVNCFVETVINQGMNCEALSFILQEI